MQTIQLASFGEPTVMALTEVADLQPAAGEAVRPLAIRSIPLSSPLAQAEGKLKKSFERLFRNRRTCFKGCQNPAGHGQKNDTE